MSAADPPPARKPALTGPVSRFLGVADAARSLAFYRDVLGFDVQPVREEYGFPAVAEVVSGPACLQLGLQDRAVDRILLRVHPGRGHAPRGARGEGRQCPR